MTELLSFYETAHAPESGGAHVRLRLDVRCRVNNRRANRVVETETSYVSLAITENIYLVLDPECLSLFFDKMHGDWKYCIIIGWLVT
jgi:hypothetical protein